MIKIKKRSPSFDKPKRKLLTQETFFFTLEGGFDQIEISDDSSEEKDNNNKAMMNNYTSSNITNKKRNMLEEYLPKHNVSSQYQHQGGRISTDYNDNDELGVELNMLNDQYETIKQNLIELNP